MMKTVNIFQVQFRLTEDHIKLLKNMWVEWCLDEFGAPEIDPKRPYGNSDVFTDMIDILIYGDNERSSPIKVVNGMSVSLSEGDAEIFAYRDDVCDPFIPTKETVEILDTLHMELQTALQIVLRTTSFVPGVYQADRYNRDWELVTNEKS